MTPAKQIALIILVASVALHGACTRRSELRALRNMPMVAEAVVASDSGRLLPSAAGSGSKGEIVIPHDAFALSATLAEVRAAVAPDGEEVAVTIAPGDRVEVLVNDDDPRGLCLIRTEAETYCWLSARSLVITGES